MTIREINGWFYCTRHDSLQQAFCSYCSQEVREIFTDDKPWNQDTGPKRYDRAEGYRKRFWEPVYIKEKK